jgi:transcriptional regulator with PAS, ATPase and Fis domain
MQPKLLRVLEEKEIERVGGIRPVKSDFRLIVATNENLENLVEQGKFRKDLYYRLNVIPIQIPPLRERKQDIALLVEHIAQKFSRDMGTRAPLISPEVMQIFQNYYWPGNVRELSNIIERILYMIDGDTIHIRHLPIFLQSIGAGLPKIQSTLLKRLREDMEKDALIHTIRLAKDNKNKAAKLLGIHRTSLYKKMKKLNIPTKQIKNVYK